MILKKYKAIIFDLGNTLIAGDYSGKPVQERNIILMNGVTELISKLSGRVRLAIVSNTHEITSEQIKAKLAEVDLSEKFEVIILKIRLIYNILRVSIFIHKS